MSLLMTPRIRACHFIFAVLTMALAGCGQNFTVSVNDNAVYDPQGRLPSNQTVDADLQGCINLTLRQQGLEDASELLALSCSNAGISNLENISTLNHLRFLDLSYNNISNLTPLSAMNQLSGLVLVENEITNINPLFIIPTLSSVNLSGNDNISCNQLDRLQQRMGNNLVRPSNCRN